MMDIDYTVAFVRNGAVVEVTTNSAYDGKRNERLLSAVETGVLFKDWDVSAT